MSPAGLPLALLLFAVPQQPDGDVSRCAQMQPVIERTVAAAMQRLENARQSNDPAAMRAAVDAVGTVLKELRTQLAPCAALQAIANPHAAHGAPAATGAPATAPPATAPAAPAKDPHAGHAAAKPATGRPQRKAADPHAGHAPAAAAKAAPSKPSQPAAKPAPTVDPVCGMTVEPEKALTATYKGKTYYFCSAEDRLRFIRNPETYLRKKPGKP